LVENHNLNCPWRIVSVPDKIIDVEIYDWPKAIEFFLKYRNTFSKCKQIPIIEDKIIEEVKLIE
jgi:hypothetical protein